MGVFSTDEQEKIMHVINLAESKTSGEIRIAVEKKLNGHVLERAQFFFEKLDMHKTARRNGVLIYIATQDKQFAIIGDEGINKLVPNNFWDQTKEAMLKHFKNGQLVEGLMEGAKLAGKQLQYYFPAAQDDINELPNDLYIGEH